MKSKYWIAFSSMEQIDSRFIQRLYNYFGDIELAFNATLSDLSQIDGLNIKKAETFIDLRNKINPDKTISETFKEIVKNKNTKGNIPDIKQG